MQLFFAIAVWPLVFIFPETYGPRILERRAKHLRKTGRKNAWAAHELHHKTIAQVLRGHVVRPFSTFLCFSWNERVCLNLGAAMIIYEPIVQGAAIWVTVTYGIL